MSKSVKHRLHQQLIIIPRICKLQELTKLAEKPVVAIGGISTENVHSIRTTNVEGVSVISAIT